MRKWICLLLCAVLLLACAACGLGESPEATAEPTEEPTQAMVEVPMGTEAVQRKYEGVQLQYWSLLTESDPEAAVLTQAAADFEQTTGAEVTITWLSGDESALTGPMQADIFEVSGAGMTQHLSHAMDLTEPADNAGYENKSWNALRSQVISRCGSLKAIPYRPNLYGLYYNRAAFDALAVEAPPSTWQEYLDLCRMLKDNGYEGLVIDQERANLILELHMERALGWDTLKDTMVNARWRSNTMAMTMIQEAIKFAESGYLVKGNPAVYPMGQNRLAQSNAVFVAGSSSLCREVAESTLSDIRWGVMPYPGDGPGTGLLVDADVLAIHADCANPEAAFDFIMLLTTGEYDQLRADVAFGIPADPANSSIIFGADNCMASAAAQAPKWFTPDKNELFTRLWNGWYKTPSYFADQLNNLSGKFANEQSVG